MFRFERKGVTCIRNYDSEKVWYKFDPWKLKGWRNVFETDSKAEVTQECERTGLTAEWGPNDSLRIVNTQVRLHTSLRAVCCAPPSTLTTRD